MIINIKLDKLKYRSIRNKIMYIFNLVASDTIEKGGLKMNKKFYGKGINYKIWHYMYSNNHIVNIYKYLTSRELTTLNKLGIIIENRLYAKREVEIIDMSLYDYYKTDENDNIIENTYLKQRGISKEDYVKILNIFEQIYMDYNL